jgi:integrase
VSTVLEVPVERFEDGTANRQVDALIRYPNRLAALEIVSEPDEAFNRQQLARCRRELGDAAPPPTRLHDLRHAHASLLLAAGTPVKVVSERLGHSSPMITLTIYQHVTATMQREAAVRFAAIDGGDG